MLGGGYFILWLCLQGMGHEGKEMVVKLTDDKFYPWPFDFIASRTMDSNGGHHGRGVLKIKVYFRLYRMQRKQPLSLRQGLSV